MRPLFVCVFICAVTIRANPLSETNAMLYLQRFGYLPSSGNNGNTTAQAQALLDGRALHEAVAEFQRFAAINVTGELDSETLELMALPRCGVKDIVGNGMLARRKKRYTLQGSKWASNEITYKISRYPTRIKNRQKIDEEVKRAFKVWSDHSPLVFVQKTSSPVNIDIRFVRGEHGDGDPFNGPGGTLAHAFFPRYGGDAHFDDEEKWTINEYGGVNLFQVAAHEFGHSLGLSHSDVRRSLMAPFYRGYNPNFQLDVDDIEGIQALYGRNRQTTKRPPVSRRPTQHRPGPDLCSDPKIDAITRTEDKSVYIFKGLHYWKLDNEGIVDGYPRLISSDWKGITGYIDGALTWSDGKTFIFKGDKYWRFKNREASDGYPQRISVGFQGIPNDIDAVFIWGGNGKTYFFKGRHYWRYDSRAEVPVSSRYPQLISNVWEGIPNNIDAAFQWQNGRTYFFKDGSYYRFNDKEFVVDSGDPPYPRAIGKWWYGCEEAEARQAAVSSSDRRVSVHITVQGKDSSSNDEDAIASHSNTEDIQGGSAHETRSVVTRMAPDQWTASHSITPSLSTFLLTLIPLLTLITIVR